MSRRARVFRDPTANQAWPDELLDKMNGILQTLSEREAKVIGMLAGLRGVRPSTPSEVAQELGISPKAVLDILTRGVSKVQHPSRAAVLQGFLDVEMGRVPDAIRARFVGPPPDRAFCERHGWTVADENDQVCGFCACFLPAPPDLGRPTTYCSVACRQAAYRRRQQVRHQAEVTDT